VATCPRCSSRKAKRPCPALGAEICAVCCAEGRLKTILCPLDCPYLQSEHYQSGRRRARALSRGRKFRENVETAFPDAMERDLAAKIYADIYYFAANEGPVTDRAIAEAGDALRGLSPPAEAPPAPAAPLALYLRERLGDASRYPDPRGSARAARVLGRIAERARSMAGEDTRLIEEEITAFFGALDFEADLDYSPRDGKDPSAPLFEGGMAGPEGPAA
jgi:hypothetical protein